MAVQFHPEDLVDHAASQRLFAAFIAAAAGSMQSTHSHLVTAPVGGTF
jgi:gamma-glutamyl-gamma-aminobutyrate hydrolase PuuD